MSSFLEGKFRFDVDRSATINLFTIIPTCRRNVIQKINKCVVFTWLTCTAPPELSPCSTLPSCSFYKSYIFSNIADPTSVFITNVYCTVQSFVQKKKAVKLKTDLLHAVRADLKQFHGC